jgi:prolyl 4-hydroxylase
MHSEQISSRIWVIHDFFTPEECAANIAFSEGEGYADAPITTMHGPRMAKEVRDNTRVMVDDEEFAAQLFERLKPFVPATMQVYEVVGLNERFRYYRYEDGQTFRPHYDGAYFRSDEEYSQLTFMIYLNDDFEGGETKFYADDWNVLVASIKPVKGMALVFEHEQLHEGAPVTSGRKYVIRTDVMYRIKRGNRPQENA